jgi:hypothetical protein
MGRINPGPDNLSFSTDTDTFVVDPDPVGSETFRRIRGKKSFRIRAARIRNEFEVKLLCFVKKISP